MIRHRKRNSEGGFERFKSVKSERLTRFSENSP